MKNFHPEHQKLIFSGKILANEQQLKDVGYTEDKFIVVMMLQVRSAYKALRTTVLF